MTLTSARKTVVAVDALTCRLKASSRLAHAYQLHDFFRFFDLDQWSEHRSMERSKFTLT